MQQEVGRQNRILGRKWEEIYRKHDRKIEIDKKKSAYQMIFLWIFI